MVSEMMLLEERKHDYASKALDGLYQVQHQNTLI
jgi:hypothetical protein